jgi:hypothetical protein
VPAGAALADAVTEVLAAVRDVPVTPDTAAPEQAAGPVPAARPDPHAGEAPTTRLAPWDPAPELPGQRPPAAAAEPPAPAAQPPLPAPARQKQVNQKQVTQKQARQKPARQARPARPRPAAGRPQRRPAAERRSRLVAAAAAVLAIVIIGTLIHALLDRSQASVALSGSTARRETAIRGRAAAWLAGQVSRGTAMSCDPVMCAVLRAHGIPAADLDALRPGSVPGPPGGSPRPAVLIATAAMRGQLGSRLGAVYAPAVIASFGSGPGRVEVRARAGSGAAAFRALASADLVERRESGAGLLGTARIVVRSAAARAELGRGQVDERLLVVLAELAARHPLAVLAFGDRAPGASLASSPLRSVELAPARSGADASGAALARSMLAFVRAQAGSFAAARAGLTRLPDGQVGVRVEFAAPSPLGLLGGVGP